MKRGFTLIELMIAIGILGILVAVSAFALQGTRESARDARRKADLETMKSGLVLYRADCSAYPTTAAFPDPPGALVGTGTPTSCAVANTYIAQVPDDPTAGQNYYYTTVGAGNQRFVLCARLEQSVTGFVVHASCGNNCGSGSLPCNYSVTSP